MTEWPPCTGAPSSPDSSSSRRSSPRPGSGSSLPPRFRPPLPPAPSRPSGRWRTCAACSTPPERACPTPPARTPARGSASGRRRVPGARRGAAGGTVDRLQPLPHLHAGRERRGARAGPGPRSPGPRLRPPRLGPRRARRRRRRLGRGHRPRARPRAPGRAGRGRRDPARGRRRGVGAGRRRGLPPRPGGAGGGRGGEPGGPRHRRPEPALRDHRARARASPSRFAAGARRPLGSSLLSTVYRLLPNDTNLTVLRRLGVPGANLAFIDGAVRYHTPRDDLAHLDPRSVQHQGENALALVRGLVGARRAGRRGRSGSTSSDGGWSGSRRPGPFRWRSPRSLLAGIGAAAERPAAAGDARGGSRSAIVAVPSSRSPRRRARLRRRARARARPNPAPLGGESRAARRGLPPRRGRGGALGRRSSPEGAARPDGLRAGIRLALAAGAVALAATLPGRLLPAPRPRARGRRRRGPRRARRSAGEAGGRPRDAGRRGAGPPPPGLAPLPGARPRGRPRGRGGGRDRDAAARAARRLASPPGARPRRARPPRGRRGGAGGGGRPSGRRRRRARAARRLLPPGRGGRPDPRELRPGPAPAGGPRGGALLARRPRSGWAGERSARRSRRRRRRSRCPVRRSRCSRPGATGDFGALPRPAPLPARRPGDPGGGAARR